QFPQRYGATEISCILRGSVPPCEKRLVVPTRSALLSDAPYFAEHLQIRGGGDGAGEVVAPGDGQLLDALAATARGDDQLDVEAPALDGQHGEDVLDAALAEHLEAGLRVVDAGRGEHADDAVAELAAQLLEPGLVDDDVRAVDSARADHHVVALFEPGPEGIDVVERRRVVRIHEQPVLAARIGQAAPHRRTFAVV